MRIKRTIKEERDAAIRKRFQDLWDEGYRTEVIFRKIASEFTMSEKSLNRIVKVRNAKQKAYAANRI